MPFEPKPILLEGRFIDLVPLDPTHLEPLWDEAQEPEIWRWTINDPYPSLEVYRSRHFEPMLADHEAGRCVSYTVRRKSDGKLVGSTRLFDFRVRERALEIGYTWYGASARGTQVNPEAKYLLMKYAFEELGANRVQLKTDERNERSRRAMTKMGAHFEGILRRYQVRDDGFVRNTAMFSVTPEDWPAVSAGLLERLS